MKTSGPRTRVYTEPPVTSVTTVVTVASVASVSTTVIDVYLGLVRVGPPPLQPVLITIGIRVLLCKNHL